MTTDEIVQLYIQACYDGFIYDLSMMLDDISDDREPCSADCDNCPAPCGILSNKDGQPDFETFRTNFRPILAYIQSHYPEHLL